MNLFEKQETSAKTNFAIDAVTVRKSSQNGAKPFDKPASNINLLDEARNVLKLEIDALEATRQSLDSRFEITIGLIETAHKAGRKLIFMGVGKNVFIARKIAATFNSTGVSSLFMDCVSALHGDLGVCKEGDVALLFSNSGESDELLAVAPSLKRLGVISVGVTKSPTSRLGKICDHVLTYAVPTEACPLNLAPTASTTTALALGDALAMVFLKKRGFRAEDFAKYHPSGTLGKTLLLRVTDVMRDRTKMAVVSQNAKVIDAVNLITDRKTGLAAVVDENGKLLGAFSDGDFRRLVLQNENPLQENIADHMTRAPKTVQSEMMAVEAVKKFEAHKINQLIVVDEFGCPVGLVDGQDLPKLKLV